MQRFHYDVGGKERRGERQKGVGVLVIVTSPERAVKVSYLSLTQK